MISVTPSSSASQSGLEEDVFIKGMTHRHKPVRQQGIVGTVQADRRRL